MAQEMARRLKRQVFEVLEGTSSNPLIDRLVRGTIICTIVVNIVAMTLMTVESLQAEWGNFFLLIDAVAITIFSVEYILRVWSATEQRDKRFHSSIKGRLRYIVTPLALIDLAVILPVYLASFVDFDLGFLRMLRLLVMLKVMRYSPALATVGAVIYAERRSFLAALMIMITFLLFSSSIMWMIEPGTFSHVPAAMWWAIVTMTTVGYGDVKPVTPLGQAFCGVFMVFGIAMFTLPAGIVAAGFARELRRRDFVITFSMVSKVPLFRDLDAKRLAEIAALLQPRIVPPLYAVVRKGEMPDALYFIGSGEVEVELPHGMLRLGPGDFFGEMGMVPQAGTRTVNVTALTECQLLMLQADDFHHLMEGWPDMRDRINETIQRRNEQRQRMAEKFRENTV
ncbi:MAG: cyclic nucleotide-gated ion channel [Pseudomonadota bacterium]|nr:cyclic nucleotide-gated ion channel [Pseudomonadota bacterium]